MAIAVILGGGAGCSSRCDTEATFHCCQFSCIGDRPAEPICADSGWACPLDYVSSADCPKERFCLGPGPCDLPPPRTLRCCETNCDGDVLVDPVCGESGWACPEGSVSFDSCPGPRVCIGPLPGPLPDGGP